MPRPIPQTRRLAYPVYKFDPPVPKKPRIVNKAIRLPKSSYPKALKKWVSILEKDDTNYYVEKSRHLKDPATYFFRYGLTKGRLKARGYSALFFRTSMGFEAPILLKLGFGLDEIVASGYQPSELKRSGVKAVELRRLGLSAFDLRASGYSPIELLNAGFRAKELDHAGIRLRTFSEVDPRTLLRAGYGIDTLRSARFDLTEILKEVKNAVDWKLKPRATAETLRRMRFSPLLLNLAGYEFHDIANTGLRAKEMLMAGFSEYNLLSSGYKLSELREAGVSARFFHDNHYDAGKLLAAGYSVWELLIAKYRESDIVRGIDTVEPLARPQLLKEFRRTGIDKATLGLLGFREDKFQKAGFTATERLAKGHSQKKVNRTLKSQKKNLYMP
ncbi:MAG: hypothetical protein AABW59_03415 [archaeon]